MTANKPSDAIPEVMKRRIKELERDGYNEDFLRCFRNAIRSLDETDRYAHANKVQAEEIKALAARLAHEQATNANLLRALAEANDLNVVRRTAMVNLHEHIEKLDARLAEAESRQTCEGTQPYVCHALATARARLAEAVAALQAFSDYLGPLEYNRILALGITVSADEVQK